MSPEDAVTLAIFEAGYEGDSLLVKVRNGEDPGVERMVQLTSALRTIFYLLNGKAELPRDLAAALYTLGSDVPLTISSLASQGHVWRRGFMEIEVYDLLMVVQSIFEDRWLGSEQTETVH